MTDGNTIMVSGPEVRDVAIRFKALMETYDTSYNGAREWFNTQVAGLEAQYKQDCHDLMSELAELGGNELKDPENWTMNLGYAEELGVAFLAPCLALVPASQVN